MKIDTIESSGYDRTDAGVAWIAVSSSGLLGLHFALLHGAFSETLTLSWNQVYAGFIMASLGVIIQIIGLVLYSSKPRSD